MTAERRIRPRVRRVAQYILLIHAIGLTAGFVQGALLGWLWKRGT